MVRVAVIGNKEWQNKRKVQEILHGIRKQFGKDAIIISGGGNEGANYLVRKFALEFGMLYQEYNPSYTGRNLYSALPDSYYGKNIIFHNCCIE